MRCFFIRATPTVVWAPALSILVRFGVGLAKGTPTTLPRWISSLDMTQVAVIAGGITYGSGLAFAIH